MKINNVVGMDLGSRGRSTTFGRKLKETEKKDYTETITKAMDCLGIQNRALIIHGPSFPTDTKTNVEQEIGSPYANPEFLEFAKLHGFNSIQLGPMGRLNQTENSPYTSSVFEKNPLFLDLTLLSTPEYGNILPKNKLELLTREPKVTGEDHTRANFERAREINASALKTSFENFTKLLKKKNPDVVNLNKQFEQFKEDNKYWLDYYAVLDVISKKYGTDNYSTWSTQDAELIERVKDNDNFAISRFNSILREHKQEVDEYKFSQFLIDKQSKDRAPEGITFIGDLLVGASHFDELAYSDVFLKEYKIGAEHGGVMNSPQLWGISLLNPDKLFEEDGSLGPAGIFLREKLKKAMSDSGNIRIDHVMGLVDPYIYRADSVVYEEKPDSQGVIQRYPKRDKLQAGYLSQSGVDGCGNFEQILQRIVLPTMWEMNVDPREVIWENLGDSTPVFNKIFNERLNLNGISGLLWSRGEDVQKYTPNNWSYIGCHDNPPAGEILRDRNGACVKWERGWDAAWDTDYLAKRSTPSTISDDSRERYKSIMKANPKELVQAKLVDLFRSSKNIQISFMDFFGIQKPYNVPGTVGDENWTLRLAPDYEDSYHKSLENGGWAINMPKILEQALVAKTQDDIDNGKPQDDAWGEVSPTLDKLRQYERILEEPEQ